MADRAPCNLTNEELELRHQHAHEIEDIVGRTRRTSGVLSEIHTEGRLRLLRGFDCAEVFDPDQPRDEAGKFASGGGGGAPGEPASGQSARIGPIIAGGLYVQGDLPVSTKMVREHGKDRMKVTVQGENALTYEPMTDYALTDNQRARESRFADKLSTDQSDIDYANHVDDKGQNDTYGGRLQNTDIRRDLAADAEVSNDMRTLNTLPTHQPGSARTKEACEEILAMTPEGPAMAMAAGGGSGKTTILKDYMSKEASKADLILDSTMSKPSSADEFIEKALNSGRTVDYVYVHRDFDGALKGTEKRFWKEGGGRYVPPETLAFAHVGAQETLFHVAEKYKNDPRVRIRVFHNKEALPGKDFGEIEEISVAKMEKFRYTGGDPSKMASVIKEFSVRAEAKLAKVTAHVNEVIRKNG